MYKNVHSSFFDTLRSNETVLPLNGCHLTTNVRKVITKRSAILWQIYKGRYINHSADAKDLCGTMFVSNGRGIVRCRARRNVVGTH